MSNSPQSDLARTDAPGDARGFDASRLVFYVVLTAVILGGTFFAGLYSGARRNAIFRLTDRVRSSLTASLTTVSEEATTLSGTHPSHFLQPSRWARDGVTVNAAPDDGALILLSGFFDDSNELRLIQRNGSVVARWPVRFSTLFPKPTHMPAAYVPATDWNIDTHGALALPDGSVVFNFEWGGLVKLDRCGVPLWTVPQRTHHSVERAEGGGFWVPGRRLVANVPTPYPPFDTPFDEDLILKITEDGQVERSLSVPKIFYDNGLEAVLTATGSRFKSGMAWDEEIVHLNKVAELSRELAPEFPMFEAGDLLLSLREQNLLMVVDRDGAKVKWWRIGPWRRQHDPEFRRGGTIMLFNNNVYETMFGASVDVSPVTAPRVSNIGDVNPVTGEYRVLFGGRPEQELLSGIRGKVDATPGGGLFITEFEGGRVIETDAQGKVLWEYVNHYSADEVAEITEARLYRPGYFTVASWSCDGVRR